MWSQTNDSKNYQVLLHLMDTQIIFQLLVKKKSHKKKIKEKYLSPQLKQAP